MTSRSAKDVDAFRTAREMRVTGRDPPKPAHTFEESSLPAYCVDELANSGFPAPTPVQAQTWPAALSGRDVISIAETGSGKTLAFVLPAVVHINAQPYLERGDGPIVLILAPTRELAVQIQEQAALFGASSKIKSACIYGGAPRNPQIAALREGVEMCVATPGRLLDFLNSKATNLRRVTYFVLDEADRMLDLGFEPQIRRIERLTRPDRQTLLFTATWPADVAAAAAEFTDDVVTVRIGGDALKASDNVSQIVEVTDEHGKHARLVSVLERALGDAEAAGAVPKIIVFLSSKARVDASTRRLRHEGFPALSIHGDKGQEEREWVLGEFRAGKSPVMLATDVAARGLDVKDVSLVVNYDFPGRMEDYVHRIGRTGRAGAKGKAMSLFTSGDARHARSLCGLLQTAGQPVPRELAQFLSLEFLKK